MKKHKYIFTIFGIALGGIALVIALLFSINENGEREGGIYNMKDFYSSSDAGIRAYYSIASEIRVVPELGCAVELTIKEVYSEKYVFDINITNNSQHDIFLNPFFYSLEFLDGESWMKIDIIQWMEFPLPQDIIRSGGEHSSKIDLSFIPYNLEDGLYRIRKIVSTSMENCPLSQHDLIAEFKLR
jgi:hypothetical protein